jgi:hypothetical protein
VDFLKSITVQRQAEQEDERREREKEHIREATMDVDEEALEPQKNTTKVCTSDRTRSTSSQNNDEDQWMQRCSVGEAGLAAERSEQEDLLNELIKQRCQDLERIFTQAKLEFQ